MWHSTCNVLGKTNNHLCIKANLVFVHNLLECSIGDILFKLEYSFLILGTSITMQMGCSGFVQIPKMLQTFGCGRRRLRVRFLPFYPYLTLLASFRNCLMDAWSFFLISSCLATQSVFLQRHKYTTPNAPWWKWVELSKLAYLDQVPCRIVIRCMEFPNLDRI